MATCAIYNRPDALKLGCCSTSTYGSAETQLISYAQYCIESPMH